jgi:hypothetical protein
MTTRLDVMNSLLPDGWKFHFETDYNDSVSRLLKDGVIVAYLNGCKYSNSWNVLRHVCEEKTAIEIVDNVLEEFQRKWDEKEEQKRRDSEEKVEQKRKLEVMEAARVLGVTLN